MIMLRLVAWPTVVVNLFCMAIGGFTHDVTVFVLGWGGVAFAIYGLLFYWDEAREMGQTHIGYQNLAMRLRFEIREQGYSPGARLPTTKEFAKQFATTRTTVARALRILHEEGIVVILRGRGTYLSGTRTDLPRDRVELHLMAVLNRRQSGSPMPEAKFLAENLQASENTVRRVEHKLAEQGLIRRTRGGKYVKM